jgi:hypothetical protein
MKSERRLFVGRTTRTGLAIGARLELWLCRLSESALQTASAIGDDRLQRQSQGYVVPDAFTRGSSEQRTRWFTTGLKSGQVESCDTFRAGRP